MTLMKISNSILKKSALVATGISLAILTGCSTGPDAQAGTVVGGILGAATGGIVGHQSGRGLEGAAIGGGLGAIAGNMFGNSIDTRRNEATRTYRPQRSPVAYYPEPVFYSAAPPIHRTTTVMTKHTYESFDDGYYFD